MDDPNTIHRAEPATIRAGDSAKWTITEANYPAAVWTMTYSLVNGSAKQEFAAAADGDDHAVALTPAVTAKFAAGEYEWQAAVTNGVDRYTIRRGRIDVLPDFAHADHKTLDTRTFARRTLDAIEAVIEERATESELSYSIAGRTLQFTPLKDLLAFQREFAGKVARELSAERRASGKPSLNQVKVRL